MSELPNDVTWTAREALACAYCWAEFQKPERVAAENNTTPEQYWLSIAPAARNDIRRVANKKWLLAVARGQAAAVTSSSMFTDAEVAAIGENIGVKMTGRIRRIINAVYMAAARRSAPIANAPDTVP